MLELLLSPCCLCDQVIEIERAETKLTIAHLLDFEISFLFDANVDSNLCYRCWKIKQHLSMYLPLLKVAIALILFKYIYPGPAPLKKSDDLK